MDMQNLETSLPVPSVQELVRNGPLESVPLRYVNDDTIHHRCHDDDDDDEGGDSGRLQVPCIDMSRLDHQWSTSEFKRFRSACRDWGLFQIVNHGVPQESLTLIRESVLGFFGLPLEEKQRCGQRPGSLEGYGQAFVKSEDQKLDWCDMIFLRALPSDARNLELWPQNPRRFREALEEYSEEMRRLAARLVKFLVLGLGIQQQEMIVKTYSDAFLGGRVDVRMNCCPVCPEPDRVMAVSPHADISGITLLVECGDVPGLQVLKDGKWVTVNPIDGAIVVNIGQVMQIISNEIYKAPEHRAVANGHKDRHSIVAFCYPDPSSVHIGPPKELLESWQNPPLV